MVAPGTLDHNVIDGNLGARGGPLRRRDADLYYEG
jgi:hypothetical protein